jgi:hypothetical protein
VDDRGTVGSQRAVQEPAKLVGSGRSVPVGAEGSRQGDEAGIAQPGAGPQGSCKVGGRASGLSSWKVDEAVDPGVDLRGWVSGGAAGV